MLAVVQSQPHTSQVGGVPEKERTVLQLPQDKFRVAGLPSATKARIFVVEQTQPHTSQVGGVPENGWVILHLPQERFNFTGVTDLIVRKTDRSRKLRSAHHTHRLYHDKSSGCEITPALRTQ